MVGGQEPEVQVEVQPDRLRAYGLTITDVTTAVQSQYLATSGGQMKSGSGASTRSTSLRLDTRGTDLAALQSIPLTTPGGGVIELRSVANVYLGGKEADTLLSLLYVPVAYIYFDSLSKLGGRLFHWRPWTWRRRSQEPEERAAPYPVAGGANQAGERVQALHGRRRRQARRAALA